MLSAGQRDDIGDGRTGCRFAATCYRAGGGTCRGREGCETFENADGAYSQAVHVKRPGPKQLALIEFVGSMPDADYDELLAALRDHGPARLRYSCAEQLSRAYRRACAVAGVVADDHGKRACAERARERAVTSRGAKGGAVAGESAQMASAAGKQASESIGGWYS